MSETASNSGPWYTRPILGAGFGLATGIIDTCALYLFGVRFEYQGHNAAPVIAGVFSISLVALGYLAAYSARAQHREKHAFAALKAQDQELLQAHDLQSRLQRLATLGQLAGAIAHEVRNPLAIIRSSLQNIGEGLAADSSDAESCQFCVEEIDRLAEVTRSLVGFAQPLNISKRAVDGHDLLRRVKLLSRLVLANRSLTLKMDAQPDMPSVCIDPDLVTQLLLSLIGNAAESAPNGSHVTLRSHLVGGQLKLQVEDEGPGIPKDLREQVFEPLFTTKSRGSGLGLAVAKKIVEAHDGRITIDDSARGAHFIVQLPLSTA